VTVFTPFGSVFDIYDFSFTTIRKAGMGGD